MTDKKEIRSLFAIDVLPEEQEAQDRAKETIMQRLNVKPNELQAAEDRYITPCLLYTSPSPRDRTRSRMPSSA